MIDLTGRHAVIFGGQEALKQGITDALRRAGATITSPEDPAPFIAVFCPARLDYGAFLDSTPAQWQQAIHDNYEQTVLAAQAAARAMIAAGRGGRLIFLSSMAAVMPFSGASLTGTTLALLHPLAQMAAVDLGQYAITANILALGWVDQAAPPLTPEGRALIEAGIPLGQFCTPEDIGAAVCFLASDLARHITGAVIPLDGGYTLTRAPGKSAFPPIP